MISLLQPPLPPHAPSCYSIFRIISDFLSLVAGLFLVYPPDVPFVVFNPCYSLWIYFSQGSIAFGA